jgi:phosphoglycolate phosphatase
VMFDAEVYAGVPAVLAGLRERGVVLAVATSKLEEFAVPIVEHLGLRDYFATVAGDIQVDGAGPGQSGGRGSKALVIAEVLRRLGDPDPATVLMVGDRSHDVIGAQAHRLACAGAGWGYGQPGELAAAGADPICATPAELARYLGLVDAAAS